MRLFSRLQDPYLTLKFQTLCGLQPVTVDSNANGTNEEACLSRGKSPVSADSAPPGVGVSNGACPEKRTSGKVKKFSINNNDSPSIGILSPVDNDSDSDLSLSGGASETPQGPGGRRLSAHTVGNRFLHYIFTFATILGEEQFYLTFFPYCVWNLDMVVIRECVIVWSLAMYVGQALKDILRWPRPASPPVIRLETHYAQEFSMPSTHAMAGTSIPFMLAYSVLQRYQISPVLVVSIAVTWCLLVSMSRLYLGVHTILDLLAGFTLTLVICVLFIPFLTDLQVFLQTHPVAPGLTFLVVLLLSTVCYPRQDDKNRTKGDAVQVIASTGGVLIGSWFNHYYGVTRIVEHPELFVISEPTLKFVATSILRFLIGIVVLALVRTVVKPLSIQITAYCLGLDKSNKKHPDIEVAYKFITYMSMGVAIVSTIPIIQCTVGLCRPSFFTEII